MHLLLISLLFDQLILDMTNVNDEHFGAVYQLIESRHNSSSIVP